MRGSTYRRTAVLGGVGPGTDVPPRAGLLGRANLPLCGVMWGGVPQYPALVSSLAMCKVATLRTTPRRFHTELHSQLHIYSYMELIMKRRITVSVAAELLEALDHSPGANRSEKVERLLRVALAARDQQRWVSELKAFYAADPDNADRQEDLEWQALAAESFERGD